MRPQPIGFTWTEVALPDGAGELVMAMVPVPRYANVAKRQFGEPGTEHVLEPVETRNMAMHSATFAQMHEYYHQLPEHLAKHFPNFDAFRSYLLIENGFCEEKIFECADGTTAQSLAVFVRSEKPNARIRINDKVVIVRVAESQSPRSMKSQRFKESMDACLATASALVGVPPAQMRMHAGKSA